MASVEEIVRQADELSPDDQTRLVRELARTMLKRHMAEAAANPISPLPIAEDEINRIVHETRRETLRARGL